VETIELGPAGQDGTPFNADETRNLWNAIDRASDQGETTVLTISGKPAAVIGPVPGT
jgi:hypothetical protein